MTVQVAKTPGSRSGGGRGTRRERQVRQWLEAEGWLVIRAAGSLGVADLVAFRKDRVPRIVEVKSTARGPWAGFSPADRERLSCAAEKAGIEAWLAWWPPHRPLVWVPEHEWPKGAT